jgi:hypothetical protein
MKFSFEAQIYKVGINPCVKVPSHITDQMIASKGYIPVKGKINDHPFEQTLVPVKNEGYRLYVNGPMLKGSDTKVGDTVRFFIEQNFAPKVDSLPIPKLFKKKLEENNLVQEYKKLIPSRQKEILKYLNYLKTEEALVRNIDKVINELKNRNNY